MSRQPNSASWNLEVDRVVHFPQTIVGIVGIAAGGALVGVLRPVIGDLSMAALGLSIAGVLFLVVKTVRAIRMSTKVEGSKVQVRGLWSSEVIDVGDVRAVRLAEVSGMQLVELDVDGRGSPVPILSWPPECVGELTRLISAAGRTAGSRAPGGESNVYGLGLDPLVDVMPHFELRLGDPQWRREVFRAEHWPERSVMWVLGAAGVATWWVARAPMSLVAVLIAVVGLIVLDRRSRRIRVACGDGTLNVQNMWRTRSVTLDQPVRLEVVGGLRSLLVRVRSDETAVVVEAAPWADPNGLATLIERAGGVVESSFDPSASDSASQVLVDSYWTRLWRIY